MYDCHNHEERKNSPMTVQDGWTEDGRRNMIEIKTKWRDVQCGHDMRTTDPNCTGCRWRDDDTSA